MGIEIKLTDKELPISPAMIEFLDHTISGKAHVGVWADQLSETLVPTEAEQRAKYAQEVADKVLQDPLGQKAIYRAYDLLAAISIGSPDGSPRAFNDATRSPALAPQTNAAPSVVDTMSKAASPLTSRSSGIRGHPEAP